MWGWIDDNAGALVESGLEQLDRPDVPDSAEAIGVASHPLSHLSGKICDLILSQTAFGRKTKLENSIEKKKKNLVF